MNNTPDNTIKIWKIAATDNPGKLNYYHGLLTSKEITIAEKINNQLQRNIYISSHAASRLILANHLHRPTTEIHITQHENGKPFIKHSKQLHFNLSHTHNMALFGLSEQESIGIDIEHLKPRANIHNVAKRFFNISEYEWLKQVDHEKQLADFYQLWCYKEACLKGIGCGLHGGLGRFSINSNQMQTGGKVEVHSNTWHFQPINISNEYKAAIAQKYSSFNYELIDWNPPL